ncbi:MAG: hypothetical protein ACTIJK_17170, partial [Brachybacterium sp.]
MPLPRRHLLAAAPALAALTALAACGSAEPTDAGRDDSGPSDAGGTGGAPSAGAPTDLPEGWTWVDGTGAPTVSAAPALPVTVTDGTGAE